MDDRSKAIANLSAELAAKSAECQRLRELVEDALDLLPQGENDGSFREQAFRRKARSALQVTP